MSLRISESQHGEVILALPCDSFPESLSLQEQRNAAAGPQEALMPTVGPTLRATLRNFRNGVGWEAGGKSGERMFWKLRECSKRKEKVISAK